MEVPQIKKITLNMGVGEVLQDKKAIEKALLENQHNKKDNLEGSWDPIGPWGEDGGRIYSTATCALILEVYYRYARVLGAR